MADITKCVWRVGEICEYSKALLTLGDSVPILRLGRNDCYTRKIGDTQFPLKNCRYEREGDIHTITGSIPQYMFVSDLGANPGAGRELTEEEAAKYDPKYVETGRRFWTKEPYLYVEAGWVKLRERKDVRIVIHGTLVIIDHEHKFGEAL